MKQSKRNAQLARAASERAKPSKSRYAAKCEAEAQRMAMRHSPFAALHNERDN